MELVRFAVWLALAWSCAGSSYSDDGASPAAGKSIEDTGLCSNSSSSLDGRVLELDSNITYTLASGGACRVESVQQLTIRGNGSERTTIQCIKTHGNITSSLFSFIDVADLTIENIHFVGCGASVDTSEDLKYLFNQSFLYFGSGQAAAVLCNHCKNLVLSNVLFSNNTGYAFVGINLHGSPVLDGVQILGQDDAHYAPSDPRCTQPRHKHVCNSRGMLLFYTSSTLSPPSAQLVMRNSIFSSNYYKNFTDDQENSSLCIGGIFDAFVPPENYEVDVHLTLPDVGALTIVYLQAEFRAEVTILNSTFADNHGFCFGAVFVLMRTSSTDLAHLLLEGCTFTNNSPVLNLVGGGRRWKSYFGSHVTTYMQFEGPYNKTQCVSITDSYLRSPYNSITPSLSFIHFPDTHGTCVLYLQHLSTNTSAKLLYASGITRSDTLEVVVEDVQVIAEANNYKYYSLQGLDANDGLLMFIGVNNATIRGSSFESCQFSNLLGPVIVTRSANLFLTGKMLFHNNHASTWANGASILLQDSSMLWLVEPLEAEFSNNSAISGGAIASDQLVDQFCVFEYLTLHHYSSQNITEMDIHLTFSANLAHFGGNSIYMDALYTCSTRLSAGLDPIDARYIYDSVFSFRYPVDNGLYEMSTPSRQICSCEGPLNDTSRSALNCAGNSMNVTEIVTYPGRIFSVDIVSVDEDYRPVFTNMYNVLLPKGAVNIDFTGQFNWRLSYGLDLTKVLGHNCTRLNLSILTSVSENSEGVLALYPFGQIDALAIPVVLKQCPPGFKLIDKSYCGCSNLMFDNGFDCDINTGTIRRPSSDVWIGLVNQSDQFWGEEEEGEEGAGNQSLKHAIGYASNCPTGYCNSGREISMGNFTSLCTNGRVGVVCGQCPEGMSTLMGGSSCGRCSNLWLLMVLVFALGGILLVLLLFLLRMTVVTGTINGIILYANLYSFNTFPFYMDKSARWYSVFLSMLNLQLGFPVCLYDGLTTITAMYLGFAVPLYLWLIVLTIILVSRHSRVVARLAARSGIPVLATIIHLSFSKLMGLVVDGLSLLTLTVENRDGEISRHYVWFYDGGIRYLSQYHWGLFLLSLVSLVFFLVPYVVLLTGIKLFSRYQFTNRLRPFLDAFCAPYKDRWRFWFGVRLCILIFFYVCSVSLRNHHEIYTLIQTIALTLFTCTQVAIMPYKNLLVNYLDLFFLVDGTLLLIMTLYGKGVAIASIVLGVPVFLVFWLIVAFHVYTAIGSKRLKRLLVRVGVGKTVAMEGPNTSVRQEGADEEASEKSSLKVKTGTAATYSAITVDDHLHTHVHQYKRLKSGELREPLLDSDPA